MARKKGEGSFSKKPDGNGYHSWTLSLGTDPATGKERNKVIKRKDVRELKTLVRQYLRDREDGVPSANGNAMSADAWSDIWLETVRLTKERKTHKSYSDTYRLWLKERIGTKLLESIGTADLQACVNDAIRAGHNPTARYLVVVAKAMLRAAQRQKPPLVVYGPQNLPPWEGLILPAANPPRKRILSHDEIDELFAEMYRWEPYKTRDGGKLVYPLCHLIRFTLETGPREAEVLGLQEFQVDLKATPPRTVFAGQIDVDENGDPIIKPYTKGKDDRTVYLTDAAVDAIKAQRKLNAEYRAKAGEVWEEWALVFPSEAGTPVGYRNLIRQVDAIRDAINAKRKSSGEPPRAHWTFHDLRRTFGTRIAQTGATIKVTQELMGHKDPATTARIYVVAEEDEKMAAVAAMRNRREA